MEGRVSGSDGHGGGSGGDVIRSAEGQSGGWDGRRHGRRGVGVMSKTEHQPISDGDVSRQPQTDRRLAHTAVSSLWGGWDGLRSRGAAAQCGCQLLQR